MTEVIIATLTEDRLLDAAKFAEKMRDSRTFAHFRHTRPVDMLNDSWKVWLLYDREAIGQDVIGWMQAQMWGSPKEHIARIGLALLEEYRGRGLGTVMVDYMLSEMSHKRKIEATVYSDNIAMLTIYLKRGFHVEGCFVDEERWDGERRDILSLAKFNTGGSRYD